MAKHSPAHHATNSQFIDFKSWPINYVQTPANYDVRRQHGQRRFQHHNQGEGIRGGASTTVRERESETVSKTEAIPVLRSEKEIYEAVSVTWFASEIS